MRPGFDLRPVLVTVPAVGLALGFALSAFGSGDWPDWIWAASTLPVLAALLVEIVSSLRRGDIGLDIVAALSMTAALIFGEELAACVVALMYSGGQYLESFAERHARREMTALLSRVPRSAVLHRDGALEDVPIEAVAIGDRLLIRQGDIVPVDGTVASGVAVLDQSALTGESMPVQRKAGEPVMSGSTNAGDAFDLMATRRAAESTYAGIVRLVESAQRSKAPMSRLADRFSILFLIVTIAIAAAAWFWTGDPIRAVAVLVVATPCPLILAVPVAIVSGLSRAAKQGILIKGGKALENMARRGSSISMSRQDFRPTTCCVLLLRSTRRPNTSSPTPSSHPPASADCACRCPRTLSRRPAKASRAASTVGTPSSAGPALSPPDSVNLSSRFPIGPKFRALSRSRPPSTAGSPANSSWPTSCGWEPKNSCKI
jgi:hypothetical protein